ncbi:MAG: hypothetical protein IJI22_04490 [Bacilli bacterium]|nr:hypothetical protein [Bacilli bacterium]
MSKSKNEKNNYVLLVVIFVLTIAFVLYLCRWYNVYNEYKKNIPVIRDSLYEIVNDDLEHYIMDNPTSVVYMCTASNDKCRTFEKKFKKYLKTVELTDSMVYLNLSDLDQDEFVNNFNSKYDYKVKLTTDYPAFVYFEDGEVVAILQGKEDSDLTLAEVKQFLKLNEIGE